MYDEYNDRQQATRRTITIVDVLGNLKEKNVKYI